MTLAFWVIISWVLVSLGSVVITREFYRRKLSKYKKVGMHLHDMWIASLRQEQYLKEEIEDFTRIQEAGLDCIERIRGPLDKKQTPVETSQDV